TARTSTASSSPRWSSCGTSRRNDIRAEGADVIPAQAGIHVSTAPATDRWVPAFAGTTVEKRDVRLYRPAHIGDDPGHGGGRGVCLRAIVSEPGRPGGDRRRRHRDRRRHYPHP